MEIIKIDKPLQDKNTRPEDIQFIDGDRFIPWCVKTEMVREKEGGWVKWVNDKENFCNENKNLINGIFLYDIKALNQKIIGEEEEEDIVYYIRYDLYRKLTLSERFEWLKNNKPKNYIEPFGLTWERNVEINIKCDMYSYVFNNPIYCGEITKTDDEERHCLLDALNVPR